MYAYILHIMYTNRFIYYGKIRHIHIYLHTVIFNIIRTNIYTNVCIYYACYIYKHIHVPTDFCTYVYLQIECCDSTHRMTVSTENATPPKSTKSRNSDSSRCLRVQIQIEFLVRFEFVPNNSNFSIWWISGGVAFSAESIMMHWQLSRI